MYPPSPPQSSTSHPSSPLAESDDASQPGPSSWSSAPSPTNSEAEANFLDEYEEAEARRADAAESEIHTPPTIPSPSSSPTGIHSNAHQQQQSSNFAATKPLSHPYPRPNAASTSGTAASSRPRIRGLAPLTSVNPLAANGNGPVHMPKSQPLSRALFNRIASDTPHAGMKAGGKPKGAPKLIVPTKAFRTTFELGLSASELARR